MKHRVSPRKPPGGRLPAGRRATIVAGAILLALAVLPLMPGAGAYVLSFGTRLMIFAIAALSLDLILGFGAMVSFGHAAFLGIGAYAAGILVSEGHDDLLLIAPVALAACAAFAFGTGAVAMRTQGVAFIMITLAFGQMAYFIANSLSEYGGSDGLTLWSRATLAGFPLLKSDRGLYYTALVSLAGAWALLAAIVASRFGRVLRALRENPARVAALGFDTVHVRLAAYVIAAVLCGWAGVLFANQTSFVSPALLSWQRSGELIVMVVLGGLGTLSGAILGAAAYLLLEEGLSHVTPYWKLIFGPLLVLVVLWGKGGLMGLIARLTGGSGKHEEGDGHG